MPRILVIVSFVALASCGKTRATGGAGPDGSSLEASSGMAITPRPCDARLTRAPTSGYARVFLHASNACALHANGKLACWGPAAGGRGTDTLACDDPAWVDGLEGVTGVAMGGGSAVCVRTTNDQTWCWGLGPWAPDGTSYAASATPVRAPHLDKYEALAMAPEISVTHACGIEMLKPKIRREALAGRPAERPAVACWGHGALGELARPNPDSKWLPPERVLVDATAVAAGPSHTCAAAHGAVMCWGYGEGGALGDGDLHERNCHIETAPHTGPGYPGHYRRCEGPEPIVTTPSAVRDVGAVTQLVAGSGMTCALEATGRVKCWGKGFGVRATDLGFDDVVEIAGDETTVCARTRRGDVRCRTTSAAVKTDAFAGATSIASSGGKVCAVVGGGVIRCLAKGNLAAGDWTDGR